MGYDLTADAGAPFDLPGNPLYAALAASTLKTLTAVNCGGGVKFEAGSNNAYGEVVIKDGSNGTNNSDLKRQGFDSQFKTRRITHRLHRHRRVHWVRPLRRRLDHPVLFRRVECVRIYNPGLSAVVATRHAASPTSNGARRTGDLAVVDDRAGSALLRHGISIDSANSVVVVGAMEIRGATTQLCVFSATGCARSDPYDDPTRPCREPSH